MCHFFMPSPLPFSQQTDSTPAAPEKQPEENNNEDEMRRKVRPNEESEFWVEFVSPS